MKIKMQHYRRLHYHDYECPMCGDIKMKKTTLCDKVLKLTAELGIGVKVDKEFYKTMNNMERIMYDEAYKEYMSSPLNGRFLLNKYFEYFGHQYARDIVREYRDYKDSFDRLPPFMKNIEEKYKE